MRRRLQGKLGAPALAFLGLLVGLGGNALAPPAAPALGQGGYPADAVDVQTDTLRPQDDLLFTSIRHLASLPAAGEPWRPEVFARDLETGQYHRLTFMDDQVMRHMALSPDRRKLAITRIPSDTNGDTRLDELDAQLVWIVELAAGKAWPLTEADASAGAGGVDWLDNENVVFNYAPPGGLYDLAKAHYLTKARTMLTNTPTIGEADVGASVDGSTISYIAVDTNEVLGFDQFGPILKGKVWLRNADGSNPRRITDGGPVVGRAGPLPAGDYDPELSPDGTKVTFGREVALGTNDFDPQDGIPGAGTHRIFSADVNTLAVTELTQNDSVALIPDWAPDGTIYFTEVAVTAEHVADPYLGLASTTEAGGLSRLEPFPAAEIWKGAQVVKLVPPETDADGDGALNGVDGDDDGDGYADSAEGSMTTDSLGACPTSASHDAWPPDRDRDKDADIGDVIANFGMGKINTPANYDARSDANGDGDNDIGDVIQLYGMGRINTRCATFTFTNNTGGPVDDVHIVWSQPIAEVYVARDSQPAGWSNRGISGGGTVLDMDRPDASGDLAAGGTLTVVVRTASSTAPVASLCRWTLEGVDVGAC